MKKPSSIFLMALFFALLAGAGTGWAQTSDLSWKTSLRLNEVTDIPGYTLQPGDYVVKVIDTKRTRRIVQFSTADDNKVVATVMAIPDYRVTPSERSEFTYFQRAEGGNQALREWFYPANNYGIQFVYPKEKAYQIAKSSNVNVYMTPSSTATGNEEVVEVTPEQKEVTHETQVAENTPKELPKTGSDLPLVALIGMSSLAGAAGLRLFLRRSA